MDLRQALKILEVFSSEHRVRILRVLMMGELCVRDLKKIFRWPQSTTSRHLLYLERKGFASSRKDGLWRYYSLRSPRNILSKMLLEAIRKGLHGVSICEEDARRFLALERELKKIERKRYSSHKPI